MVPGCVLLMAFRVGRFASRLLRGFSSASKMPWDHRCTEKSDDHLIVADPFFVEDKVFGGKNGLSSKTMQLLSHGICF